MPSIKEIFNYCGISTSQVSTKQPYAFKASKLPENTRSFSAEDVAKGKNTNPEAQNYCTVLLGRKPIRKDAECNHSNLRGTNSHGQNTGCSHLQDKRVYSTPLSQESHSLFSRHNFPFSQARPAPNDMPSFTLFALPPLQLLPFAQAPQRNSVQSPPFLPALRPGRRALASSHSDPAGPGASPNGTAAPADFDCVLAAIAARTAASPAVGRAGFLRIVPELEGGQGRSLRRRLS